MGLAYTIGGAVLAVHAEALDLKQASQSFWSWTHKQQNATAKVEVATEEKLTFQEKATNGLVNVMSKTMGLGGSTVASMACKMESYKHLSCRQRKAMAKTMLKSAKLKEQEKNEMRDVLVHVDSAHDLCSVFSSFPHAKQCPTFQSGCDKLVKNLCEKEMLIFDGSCDGVGRGKCRAPKMAECFCSDALKDELVVEVEDDDEELLDENGHKIDLEVDDAEAAPHEM